MSPAPERRLLQTAIAVAGAVPVGGGLWGVLGHMTTTGAASTSNARYLSGLLLAIGLTPWIGILFPADPLGFLERHAEGGQDQGDNLHPWAGTDAPTSMSR